MSNIKEELIQSYLEGHSYQNQQTADQERANRDWKEAMEGVKLGDDELRGEIDDAAFELAGSYQYDGMHRGFDLACRLFGEMLGEMLRGGAQA